MAVTGKAIRLDAGLLRPSTRTPQGFLRVDGHVGRAGIYEYINTREDEKDGFGKAGTVRRELRPEEEVFSATALAGFEGAPLTARHPSTMVDTTNVRSLEVGTATTAARRDGNRVAAAMVVKDKRTIERMEKGELRELSPGYKIRIDRSPGRDARYATPSNPEGRYDVVQRDIEINHLALVDSARGGTEMRVRMDGREVSVARLDEQSRDDLGRFGEGDGGGGGGGGGSGGGGGGGDKGGGGPKQTGDGGGKKDFPGPGTHSSDKADDAKGSGSHFENAKAMRDSNENLGWKSSAIKDHGDGTYSFQTVQPATIVDNKGRAYPKSDPAAQKMLDRGKATMAPEKVVTRHFDKTGAMTVTDHSKPGTAHDGHPSSVAAAGGNVSEAQPWKDGARESINAGKTSGPRSSTRSREVTKKRADGREERWVVDDDGLDHAGDGSPMLDGDGPQVRTVAALPRRGASMDIEEQIRSLKAQVAEGENVAAQRLDALTAQTERADRAEARVETLESSLGELAARLDAGSTAMETAAIKEHASRADAAEAKIREFDMRFDAAVAARVSIVQRATAVMGEDFNAQRMSNREVQSVVVKRLDAAADVSSNVSDAYIAGRFDSLVEMHSKTARSLARAGDALSGRTDARDASRVDASVARRGEWRNQWKQPLPNSREARERRKDG